MDRQEYRRQLVNLFLSGMMCIGQVIDEAFNFADSNPNWIRTDKQLPPKRTDRDSSDEVLCIEECGIKYLLRYNYFSKRWLDCENRVYTNITHWLDVQPPRKEAMND